MKNNFLNQDFRDSLVAQESQEYQARKEKEDWLETREIKDQQ